MIKFFCFFVLFFGIIEAKEKQICKEKKKYDLCICAVLNNDSEYLLEWIEHHRLVGVDHFYLYNNGRDDFVRQALKPLIKKDVVTLIPWKQKASFNEIENGFVWALSTQIPAYENATYLRGTAETKWLICLDLNEYLIPIGTNNVNHILEKYANYSGLLLVSDCFDHYMEAKKSIFKPELCKGFSWPPYQSKFQNDCEVVKISPSELRINRYFYPGPSALKRKACQEILNLENYEIESLEFLP